MTANPEGPQSGPAPDDSRPSPDPLPPHTVLVQRPRPEVEWVEVDREIVAWVADPESLHLLDPVASLVFQLSDGVTPLEATAHELAEAFVQPVEIVQASVCQFAGELLSRELVQVVR